MLIDPNGYVVYSKQFMSSPRLVLTIFGKHMFKNRLIEFGGDITRDFIVELL